MKFTYLNKWRKYRTVEIHFRYTATAWVHSTIPLKTEELLLLHAYRRKHFSRLKVEDIPPEIDVTLLVEQACWHGRQVRNITNIIRNTQRLVRTRSGSDYAGHPETLENVTEIITIEEVVLRVRLQSRVLHCFECDQRAT